MQVVAFLINNVLSLCYFTNQAFSTAELNLANQSLGACFSPYIAFFNLQTRLGFSPPNREEVLKSLLLKFTMKECILDI